MARGQEILANAEAECPFCKASIKSRRQIESHIARHHVQVSLMVLNSSIVEEADEEVSTEDSEEDSADLPEFPITNSLTASDTIKDKLSGIREGSMIPRINFKLRQEEILAEKDGTKKSVACRGEESDDSTEQPLHTVPELLTSPRAEPIHRFRHSIASSSRLCGSARHRSALSHTGPGW